MLVDTRYNKISQISAPAHLIPEVCYCPGDDQTCSHQEHRCGHTALQPHQGLIGTWGTGGIQKSLTQGIIVNNLWEVYISLPKVRLVCDS